MQKSIPHPFYTSSLIGSSVFSACEDAQVFVIESSTWGSCPDTILKDCLQELAGVIVSAGNTTTAEIKVSNCRFHTGNYGQD